MTSRVATIDAAIRPLRLSEQQWMGRARLAGKTENVFVCARSADGVAGYGEAATWAQFCAETPTGIRDLIRDKFAPLLVGRPVLDRNANYELVASAIPGNPAAKAAVEMALTDLAARTLGIPATALFGGPVRESLGLSYSIAAQDLAAEREAIAEQYARGYRIFKLKTGILGWRTDVTRLEALLAAGDDISVRLDFNGTGQLFEMAQFVHAIAGYPVEFIEQPFPPGDLQALRRLREVCPFAVCADESCRGRGDIVRIIRDGLHDVVSLKVGKLGGLRATEDVARLAVPWGVRCYAGAFSETRLATSAALHLMLTLENLVDGCDYYFSLVTVAAPELAGGFRAVDGRLTLGGGAGFGVDLPGSWFR